MPSCWIPLARIEIFDFVMDDLLRLARHRSGHREHSPEIRMIWGAFDYECTKALGDGFPRVVNYFPRAENCDYNREAVGRDNGTSVHSSLLDCSHSDSSHRSGDSSRHDIVSGCPRVKVDCPADNAAPQVGTSYLGGSNPARVDIRRHGGANLRTMVVWHPFA